MYFQQEYPSVDGQAKIFYIYENSSNCKNPVEYKMRNRISTFNDLAAIFKFKKLRLFNEEGAEFFEDDLRFIKNKTSFYASNGDQFDPHNCFSQYEIVKKLSHHSQGRTFLASHRHSGQKIVLKIIKIDLSWDIDSLFVQSQILKSLKHDNIVKILNCIPLKNMQLAIIMQYIEGQPLFQYISNHGHFDQETSKIFCKQIINGLMYCRQNNLTHQNLQFQNVILSNSINRKINIINFGFYGQKLQYEVLDCNHEQFLPPQCFYHDYEDNQQTYQLNGKIDVWTIGIILYIMICSQLPFKGNNTCQMIQNIKRQLYKIPILTKRRVSKQCIDIIQRCLDLNHQTRITIGQLLGHDWFFQLQFNYNHFIIYQTQDHQLQNYQNINHHIHSNQQKITTYTPTPSSKQIKIKITNKKYGDIKINKKKSNNILSLKYQQKGTKQKQNYLQILTKMN